MSDSDAEVERELSAFTEGKPKHSIEANEVLDFGWAEDKPLTGRRATKEKIKKIIKPGSFETMNLSQSILKGIKRKGFTLPTPIQRKAMPLILMAQDVVGMARTGSGKTAAFVIPMLERLKEHSTMAGSRAVILSPTRELALQTAKVVKELGRYTNLRYAILVGGDSMEAQFAELAANPDVIIATPGRLMHHLQEIEGMSLKAVQYCVFDEADRLFEMGFAEQLRAILTKLSPTRQTLLFSATLPTALAEFARAGLKTPEFVRLDADNKLSQDLSLAFFTVSPQDLELVYRREDKFAALLWLLREMIKDGQPTIIFASTRHHVEFLHTILQAAGMNVTCVYGAMDQAARKIHIGKFRAGKSNVLVTTDVAARGLDIPLLDNVINYDFPAKPKLFIHRAGRAARAGRKGSAYSLLTRDEIPYLLDLHLFLSRPLFPAPNVALAQASKDAEDLDPTSSTFGSFPQVALEDGISEEHDLIAKHDLQGAVKSTANAFSLYVKTRPPASAESISRAKDMAKEGPHPLIAKNLPASSLTSLQDQVSLKKISQKLKEFRPSATVLEAEVASARRGGDIGSVGVTPANEPHNFHAVMKRKRLSHDDTIKATKKKKLDETESAPESLSSKERQAAAEAAILGDGLGKSGRFRDSDFFVSSVPASSNRFEEEEFSVRGGTSSLMDNAVLDLMADDEDGMAQQQRRFHWDKRKRQYVQLQPNEKVLAGKRIRTESGSHAKAGGQSSGLYKKWSKAHHAKVMPVGLQEDDHAPRVHGLSDRFKKGGRGWKNPMKLKNMEGDQVPSELKRRGEIMKARKDKERRQVRQKGKRPGSSREGPGSNFKGPKTRSTKYGGEKGKSKAPSSGQKSSLKKKTMGKSRRR